LKQPIQVIPMFDNSSLLPVSAPIAHFLEFFCLHGTPANSQTNPPVQIIVNHGYALGFCPDRGQPLWAAYQVAAAVKDLDFQRPEFFYDDPRLPEAWRIGTQGYGRVAGQTYDRGHMVPNFAINTQFGRVAQFETFLMSNIVPQRSPINRGIWKNLEHGIVKSYAPMRKHVWVMTGPVFGANPPTVQRRNGKQVPVPEALFLIIAEPERYPFDAPGNLNILALMIPQEHPSTKPETAPVSTLPEIEARTGLTFFPRLSPQDKAKLVTHTSPTVWPFEAITPGNSDVPAPEG
jgi:endonuclease G, mitochondrial